MGSVRVELYKREHISACYIGTVNHDSLSEVLEEIKSVPGRSIWQQGHIQGDKYWVVIR